MILEPFQLSNLIQLTSEWVSGLKIQDVDNELGEVLFTGNYLYPKLKLHVESLFKPGLYVRGDGGPVVQPLVWENISFYPDLAIVTATNKYIAFEVKILREIDPGGFLTKAIGQTVLYSHLSYDYSFGLIFDSRENKNNQYSWSQDIYMRENCRISLFK